MLKSFYAIVCILFLTTKPLAQQQCGNCEYKPEIAAYDLDVQVPQPELKEEQAGWYEWSRLIDLAKKTKNLILENTGNCFKVKQVADAKLNRVEVTKDGRLLIKGNDAGVGLYYLNVAPSGNLKEYADYLTTGFIKQQGNGFVLHFELQTACSRRTVASATVSFDTLSSQAMYLTLADQVASQLTPLIEKIKKFELEERQKNKSLTLLQNSLDGPIKVVPLKKTLKAGESTEVSIELKDCDGVPVQGREILFTETEFEGLKIHGTVGGTVAPAKVITDANGRASARFTLNAGAREAIINAHSPGNEVKGCASMLRGYTTININRVYRGFVEYSYQNFGKCNEEVKNDCSLGTASITQNEEINYYAMFYSDHVEKGETVIHFSEGDRDEGANKVWRVMESGSSSSELIDVRNHTITCESAGKGQVTTSATQVSSNGTLQNGRFSFGLPSSTGGVGFSLSIDFDTDETFTITRTAQPQQNGKEKGRSTVSFELDPERDTEFTFKRQIINGKMIMTIEGTRTANQGCSKRSIETLKAAIIEE